MMIYENFIFCLNVKKFRNYLLFVVSFNCVVMKIFKVFIRNFFKIQVMYEGLFFFLDNVVEWGYKKLVDFFINDGIFCFFCQFDSLLGIK